MCITDCSYTLYTVYCTRCRTGTFSVRSHTLTAAGLHHQLIVTQEIVCVLLQSPAILSAPHTTGCLETGSPRRQRMRSRDEDTNRAAEHRNTRWLKNQTDIFIFLCVYFTLWLFNLFFLSFNKLQIHYRSEKFLFFFP